MTTILERYIKMEISGMEAYFDADEIVELLDHFDETNEPERYQKVLNLGERLHPNNTEIKLRICKSLILKEKYTDALDLLEQMADTENQDFVVFKLECMCALNQYEEVLAYIESRLPNNSEEIEDIFECLAPFLNEIGKNKEAQDLVKRGLSVFPHNLILKEEFCYHLESQGETVLALRICNELIDSNPYFIDYWYIQGRLHLIMGEYEKAIESFDFALACEDTDLEVMILKIYSLLMNENYELAADLYIELLTSEANLYDQAQAVLSECFIHTDRFEKYYLLFRELIEKSKISQQVNLFKIASFDDSKSDNLPKLLPESDLLEDLLMMVLQIFIFSIKNDEKEAIQGMKDLLQVLHKLYAEEKESEAEKMKGFQDQLFSKNMQLYLKDIYSSLNLEIDNTLLPIHKAFENLIHGHLDAFCELYEKCPSYMISTYVSKLFTVIKRFERYYLDAPLLLSKEIIRNSEDYVSSDLLSSHFIINKHLHN